MKLHLLMFSALSIGLGSPVVAATWSQCDGVPVVAKSNRIMMNRLNNSIPNNSEWDFAWLRAMASWNTIGSDFRFEPGTDADNAWRSGNNISEVGFDDISQGNAIAVTFTRSSCAAGIVEADVIFDTVNRNGANNTWQTVDTSPEAIIRYSWNAHNFELTALHELGHAMGLGHEDRVLTQMNPFSPSAGVSGSWDFRRITPHGDDREGMRILYGRRTQVEFMTTPYRLIERDGQKVSVMHRVNGVGDQWPAAVANVHRGDSLSIEWGVGYGEAHSGSLRVRFYLSRDRSITTGDVALGTITLTNGGAGTFAFTHSFTVPSSIAAGDYWAGYIVDPDNDIAEREERDNSQDIPVIVRVNNRLPIANAGPDRSLTGTGSVTLDGSASSDPDGAFSSLRWELVSGLGRGNIISPNSTSTRLEFATIPTSSSEVSTYRLTVTDRDGASSSDTVRVTQSRPSSRFAAVAMRGTFNNWQRSEMILLSNNTWQLVADVPASASARFKFDAGVNWDPSYGENDGDGIADLNGDDIYFVKGLGKYRVTFNDLTLRYSVQCIGGGCLNGTNWHRTVIFMHGQTVSGQDMFMRGGLDFVKAREKLGIDCNIDKWLCAIPILHNGKFALPPISDPSRVNDKFLDWFGAEVGQGNVQGSPLVWTTNNATNPKKVDVDGYGYTPLNTWGDHYWMLDVSMDCAKTVNGWFELKSFISNGPGWEADVAQPSRPYASGNHFGRCGKINAFRRGDSNPVVIKDF
jgi:hypothetical protein